MQTLESIMRLIDQVSYKDWTFLIDLDGDNPYLQIIFMAPDMNTGETEEQLCRKWALSYEMTDSEVVQTAFAATIRAVKHEAEEFFQWKNQPIFRPHYDINALYELSSENRVEKREVQ